MNVQRLAIRLMVLQATLFTAETLVIHHVGSGVSVMQIGLVRAGAGVILALAVARTAGLAVIRTRQLPLQLLRGTMSLLYLWVMIYSFGQLPFADATAISYTQPMYIAAFSALILGEAVSGARWAAAVVGVLGALLIAKPAFVDWHSAYAVALIGTSLNGLAFVLNRHLQREDSEATTMLYTNMVCVLGNLPAVFMFMQAPPALDILLCLSSLLFLGPIGMYAGIIAAKHADASVLGPYTLLRLVIAITAGILICPELPDFFGACGAMLIFASCIVSPQARRRAAGLAFLNRTAVRAATP